MPEVEISPAQMGKFEEREPAPSTMPEDEGAKEPDLLTLLNEQAKRLQIQSAAIGKLTNTVARLQKLAPVEEPDQEPKEKPKTKAAADPMAERFSKLEARLQAQESAAKVLALRDALASAGVNPDSAKQYAKWISLEHGDAITAELDETGEYTVSVNDTPISDWTQAYLESDAGKALVKTRRTKEPVDKAHTGSARSGSGGKVTLDSVAFSKAAAERVLAARKERKSLDTFMNGFAIQ